MSKRIFIVVLAALLCAVALPPASALGAFGLKEFDVTFTERDGSTDTEAGSHPFAMNIFFTPNTIEAGGKPIPEEPIKDVLIPQIEGFVGNQIAVPPCSILDFLIVNKEESRHDASVPECADGSAIGRVTVYLAVFGGKEEVAIDSPVYLIEPPPGMAAKLGFWVKGVPVTADINLSEEAPYNIIGASRNISQLLNFFGAKLTLWGNPASPLHDEERGECHEGGKSCPAGVSEVPFLTVPRACQGPLATKYETDSWQNPGPLLPSGQPNLSDPRWVTGEVLTHDASGNPEGFGSCGKLPFNPSITAQPTSRSATSPTGLDFSLDVDNPGLTNPSGISGSDIRKAVVTLPEGFTANPSLAEGLAVCTEAQLAAETASSGPGEGCPEASKIGSVEVQTPLLGESLRGSLFIAEPYANPFESLIALYVVIKSPDLGVVVRQALKVEPDPKTGQLRTVADDIPQLPFSHFKLHFREGGRSPLISPPSCGSHTVKATLYPWSGSEPVESNSTFQILSGPHEGPCPSGGIAPFHPGFEAGTTNNSAGAYSPFYMRLTRGDAEQDMTKFSAVLPPGVVGKIAGLSKCPEAAIAQARVRTGPHGAREELEHPSCPQSSLIGHTLAGAGVGSELTYVSGSLYLGGPYRGDPLSVVSVTPAMAGPFDAGTVVVRVALTLNPETGEVEADGAGSDPIPHILKGIPLNVRDLRVYVDRPDFTLNATSCEPSLAKATLFGSFLNPLDPSDDVPIGLSARYQAADCASLGFKPKLQIKLKGGTKRGAHPALTALVTPRRGDANFAKAVVRLPHSAFLDQGHIRTICTRVQFNAGSGNGASCPQGSIYGKATAWSPLLEEPLAGPVYLRSSNHNLPDLVVALHGLVDINLAARIDSIHGGIRSTFTRIPDAPVSRFRFQMQGGKKGLIQNSTNLCAAEHRAEVELAGQNGKLEKSGPVVSPSCGSKHQKRARHR